MQHRLAAKVTNLSLPEEPSRAALVHGPVLNVVRVRPTDVAKRSFRGKLDPPRDQIELLDKIDSFTQSAVSAENAVPNDRCDRKQVKNFMAQCPNSNVVIELEAIRVKAIHVIHLARLVVPAEKPDSVWVLYLQCSKESKRFERIITAIDIITHEKIIDVIVV
jgi:hypothetical protein